MCLITHLKRPKIASKDITVYKILTEDLSSYYYSNYVAYNDNGWNKFQYQLGLLYKTKLINTKKDSCFDSEDRATLINEYNVIDKDLQIEIFRGNLKSIGPGFHSALTKERLERTLKSFSSCVVVLVECTIPKGSRYYTNPSGLVVSNQIIINKVLNKY